MLSLITCFSAYFSVMQTQISQLQIMCQELFAGVEWINSVSTQGMQNLFIICLFQGEAWSFKYFTGGEHLSQSLVRGKN